MICPTIKTHVENLTRRKTRIMYENVNFFSEIHFPDLYYVKPRRKKEKGK